MSDSPQPDTTIKVRVQPGASRSEILECREGVWRLRVAAPPEGGRANQAVIALLAEALGVPRGRVHIQLGHASRDKLVLVKSLEAAEVQRRLEAQLARRQKGPR
jgi:uncharacterized protein